MKKMTVISICLILAAVMLFLSGCPAVVVVGAAGAAAGGGYAVGKDKRSVEQQVEDQNLAASIKREFNNDEQLKDLGLTVYSFLGNVFLVGIKMTDEQEALALSTAQRFRETKSAKAFLVKVDQIDTAQEFAGDSAITAQVKARLAGDTAIESMQINVKTVRGYVVLLGIVDDDTIVYKAKWQAEQVVGKDKVVSFLLTAK
ncbi:MAG: BON domain-containing protein [Thermodesulfobacteriota bacterium]